MAVTVRLFASVREAAGTGETVVESGTVSEVLAGLRQRYGPTFTSRLWVSTVLVDGDAVSHDADVDVADGAEVAILPPVSGGSTPPA